MSEHDLIVTLCREAGDDVDDPDLDADFRANHDPHDISAAAAGDVAALVRLRRACGLPVFS